MNDWRWNGNGSLYENLLLILNGVSTTLTSIPLQKVLTRFWIFFWAMLEYLPMYGNLKNLVSVFTSVLFPSGLLWSFKFRYFFFKFRTLSWDIMKRSGLVITIIAGYFIIKGMLRIYLQFLKLKVMLFHFTIISIGNTGI